MTSAARVDRGAIRFAVGAVLAILGATSAFAKDIGPTNARCDNLDKASPAWASCLDAVKGGLDDAQLFYAGYWLARSGAYERALGYLKLARHPDERILTYIGFATRKLGDIARALAYYDKALDVNPDYTIARAYLGEAFLTLDEPEKAKEQLAEVGKRCGSTCAEYAELATEIARYERRG